MQEKGNVRLPSDNPRARDLSLVSFQVEELEEFGEVKYHMLYLIVSSYKPQTVSLLTASRSLDADGETEVSGT